LSGLLGRLPYRYIVGVDLEYGAAPGGRQIPRCLVCREFRSGCLIRVWEDELLHMRRPPYSTGPETLFVAFYVPAEIACHSYLGWPVPTRILDLYVEFKAQRNGLVKPGTKGKHSLLGALAHFGLDTISAGEKESMRELALRGGPWTATEKRDLLDYCQSDVDALVPLTDRLLPQILEREKGLAQALLRGRGQAAIGQVQDNGIPIDVPSLRRLQDGWEGIQDRLIADLDKDFGVFEGRTFKQSRFSEYLQRHDIPWPRTASGLFDLESSTFREMVRTYHNLAPLHELRETLGRMRLHKLPVGEDGRNRTVLWSFQARSARFQPSNAEYIFGPHTWTRSLIKPTYGSAVAYLDYASQEFMIMAVLSGDQRAIEAYMEGDVYLAFAKQAGLAPSWATAESHKTVRDQCKALVLGIGYGMGAYSLARRMGQPTRFAKGQLELYRNTYPKMCEWTQAVIDTAMLYGCIRTVFGWPLHVGEYTLRPPRPKGWWIPPHDDDDQTVGLLLPNPRSLQNFPCQGNGAEMLRLALCLGVERGVKVIAPVHDAVMLEGSLDRVEDDVRTMQRAMVEASRIVLGGGLECRVDIEGKAEKPAITRFPDRYSDPRGAVMWKKTMAHLDALPTPGLRSYAPGSRIDELGSSRVGELV
jgi:DNA polymerase-1